MADKDDWALARRVCATLVNEAVRKGSSDNVSAVVVVIKPPISS